MSPNQVSERIQKLQPRLERIAWNIHLTHYPDHAPDDILQEMNLYILEQARANPAYLDHPDKYVCNGAAFYARTWCRNQYANRRISYDQHPGLIEAWLVVGDDDLAGELAPDIADALTGLDAITRRIAAALAGGCHGADLCAMTGLSPQQISYRRRELKRALAFAAA